MKLISIIFILLHFCISQVVSDFVFNGTGATALAGAVTSCPEQSRMYSQNPAGLSGKSDTYIFLHQSNIFGLSDLSFQGAFIGTDIMYLGYLGLTIEKNSVKYLKTELSSEQSIGINKAFILHRDRHSTFDLGVNLNFMEVKFGDSAGSDGNGTNGLKGKTYKTGGVDVGLLASIRDKYNLGAFIKNINKPMIGNGISRQDLPRRISLGVSYRPIQELVTSFEIERELGREIQIQSGFIFSILPSVEILMGIQSNPGRMGAGFHFDFQGFEFNWSILSHHILPPTQFYSLGYSFE